MRGSGPATLLFFWDYDTQWGADRSRNPASSRSWGALDFQNSERLLELHAEHEVPACFAVVGAAALPGERPYHDPAQIRRIHEAGHEIASHSHRHEWLPGLGMKGLKETLRCSKDALEQCIGAPVATFVPPYNQPFDHALAGSFSLSERRAAGPDRIDVTRLCAALHETGYRTCRVSYRSAYERLLERVTGRRLDRPQHATSLCGVTCVRLNTPAGFGTEAATLIERCVRSGGIAVVYGHPHSLHSGGSQDERLLVQLLKRIRSLREQQLLQVRLPRHLSAQD